MDNNENQSKNENGRKNLFTLIRFLLPTLSKAESAAASYLLENPELVSRESLSTFAAEAGCGQASIIRLCKRLKLSGFSELKSELVTSLLSGEYSSQTHHDAVISIQGTMLATLKRVFEINIQTLRDTLELATNEYEMAFRALLNAKQICFFAIGDALFACEFAAMKFRRIGYHCYVNSDADMQIIDAYNMGHEDVAIAVSHTGNTRQVVNAMEIAHDHGAKTICITKLEKSRLTACCDIQIFTSIADVTLSKEVIARRVAEQAILEALYIGVHDRLQPLSGRHIKETSVCMNVNKFDLRVPRNKSRRFPDK